MRDNDSFAARAARPWLGPFLALSIALLGADVVKAADAGGSLLASLHTNSMVASTVPANGDVNPYGVAVVPRTSGALVRGNVLVSNFNNSANLQGTGTTIVQVAPDGTFSLFAQLTPGSLNGPCPGGVGLTTALAVLRSGWVIVGSLPTSDGTAATAGAGCLIVVNNQGQPVGTLSGNGINGPWDMTAVGMDNRVVLFVTNVLNGTVAGNGAPVQQGTVLRIVLGFPEEDEDGGAPVELSHMVIASGFSERTDPSALVIGPTGVALGHDDVLYVADTFANRIAAIAHALFRSTDAGTGTTVSAGGALNAPLGLAIAGNGHILTTNGGDGNMVETTPHGVQVDSQFVDSTGAGAGTLFGLALAHPKAVYFVNDGNNTLNVLQK